MPQLPVQRYFADNSMQRDYSFVIPSEPVPYAANFKPDFTPNEMLRLGVFGGAYLGDSLGEYPWEMVLCAKVEREYNAQVNAFKVKSGENLEFWQAKGWIHKDDPRGWFEWYCRYWCGRRTDAEDFRQITRWTNFGPRFQTLLRKTGQGRLDVQRKTRQSLLHWSYDPVPDFPTLFGESVYQKTKRVLGYGPK